MDWLKKAPTAVTVAVIIVCGVLAAVVIAAFVVLTINGSDTTEFRQWVSTLGQLLVYPLLGTTAVASVAAARSSSRAEDQTNGALEERDARISVLRGQLADRERRLAELGQLPQEGGL
jgi:high-affinity Fe2+/Pb2+ permease